MKIETGDLWDYHARGYYVGVPTNTIVVFRELVMGAGVARQAKERFPGLAKDWAEDPENVQVDSARRLIRLPTKRHWREPSPVDLVRYTIAWLARIALANPGTPIAIPALATGLGGLSWEDDVLPMLTGADMPDNVVVVLQEAGK